MKVFAKIIGMKRSLLKKKKCIPPHTKGSEGLMWWHARIKVVFRANVFQPQSCYLFKLHLLYVKKGGSY
jgi:hypothetical protein